MRGIGDSERVVPGKASRQSVSTNKVTAMGLSTRLPGLAAAESPFPLCC